eukprot:m.43150 g.43150  ORF g.43150 m.43150 type:complete len:153 (-) comp9954_c0_seq1:483-941(-)
MRTNKISIQIPCLQCLYKICHMLYFFRRRTSYFQRLADRFDSMIASIVPDNIQQGVSIVFINNLTVLWILGVFTPPPPPPTTTKKAYNAMYGESEGLPVEPLPNGIPHISFQTSNLQVSTFASVYLDTRCDTNSCTSASHASNFAGGIAIPL